MSETDVLRLIFYSLGKNVLACLVLGDLLIGYCGSWWWINLTSAQQVLQSVVTEAFGVYGSPPPKHLSVDWRRFWPGLKFNNNDSSLGKRVFVIALKDFKTW